MSFRVPAYSSSSSRLKLSQITPRHWSGLFDRDGDRTLRFSSWTLESVCLIGPFRLMLSVRSAYVCVCFFHFKRQECPSLCLAIVPVSLKNSKRKKASHLSTRTRRVRDSLRERACVWEQVTVGVASACLKISSVFLLRLKRVTLTSIRSSVSGSPVRIEPTALWMPCCSIVSDIDRRFICTGWKRIYGHVVCVCVTDSLSFCYYPSSLRAAPRCCCMFLCVVELLRQRLHR